MLTRLQVKGFKNLIDVDVRFGPFTCIAGRNGVGKSNLFDAIILLSDLTEKTLLEAITGVRGETRGAEALRVFSRWPNASAYEMSFTADMIVPAEAEDDLGQKALATYRFLRYSLTIKSRRTGDSHVPVLEVADERLDYIKKGKSKIELPFAKRKNNWFESVFTGRRTTPFISTERESGIISVHADSGHQGRSRTIKAVEMGRTVLSTLNTAETPTALIARREMQSWKLLQLEPARLRTPDEMTAKAILGSDGRGLAATLNRLIGKSTIGRAEAIRARISNRLLELVDDVRDVWVDRDEKRELLTVMARSRENVEFSARELSDGTLRFLALAMLEQDPMWSGLLCTEEPENGIHPTRIPAMLQILQALTVNLEYPVDEDNPLRQVIVNTHSPEVVGLVPADSLLLADVVPVSVNDSTALSLQFLSMSKTWRAEKESDTRTISKGEILEILNSLGAALREDEELDRESPSNERRVRVAARPDIKQMLLFPTPEQ